MRKLLSLCMFLSINACTYSAPVRVSPNLNVYSSYSDKLPGSYLVYVDTQALYQVVKPTGQACSFHKFPVDLRDSFRQSVIGTLEQLVDEIQIVDRPVAVEDAARQGKRGMIVVRGEDISARVLFVPGFWSATAESTVELSASLTVDEQQGRVLGTTASGDGNMHQEAGAACEGGARAIGTATEKAVKELLGQLGERMTNSPRMRAAWQGETPRATTVQQRSSAPKETATPKSYLYEPSYLEQP